MRLIDVLSFCVSVLGTYGLVYSLRCALPRNIIPRVSKTLDEAETLLSRAEGINAIRNLSEYRTRLAILGNQFLQMRVESHRSPGFFQQLRLVFLCGLTYRLCTLSSRIESTKLEVELIVDERQLTSVTTVQSAATTALPLPPAVMAIPMPLAVEP
ncbi:hypothetical protein BC826DRAFT_1008920 [Russula brevipes]|nr:hypothetical protein BC826DRAFT_1008920 [Russula brevipes]